MLTFLTRELSHTKKKTKEIVRKKRYGGRYKCNEKGSRRERRSLQRSSNDPEMNPSGVFRNFRREILREEKGAIRYLQQKTGILTKIRVWVIERGGSKKTYRGVSEGGSQGRKTLNNANPPRSIIRKGSGESLPQYKEKKWGGGGGLKTPSLETNKGLY